MLFLLPLIVRNITRVITNWSYIASIRHPVRCVHMALISLLIEGMRHQMCQCRHGDDVSNAVGSLAARYGN